MARQIRLRRIQQKQRMAGESGNSPSGSASPPATISAVLPLPAPPTAKGSNISTGISTVDIRIPMQVPTTVAVPSSASGLSSTIPSPSSLSCPSPLVENRPNQLTLTAFGFPSSNNLQNGTTPNMLTGLILPNACGSMGGIPAPVPLMPIPIQFQPMSIPTLVPVSPNCNAPILINPFLLLNFN
ncbi:hypothetical protein WR25_00082 [Diploscapter pachys]|uniref:Uncharacterized protein n=1 Tax=Diploscapter pachys TaxID=2018661 RepID=A0A2A2KED1_9BILA|nr:hypothetical protein WR25_00082 [Diploscapter pachys]